MQNFFKTRRIATVIVAIVLFCLTFAVGVYVGDYNRPAIDKIIGLSNKETQVTTKTDFSPFWKVWNTMNEKYPDASKTTDQDRVYGAISGLVSSLNDPYSVFFSPDETKAFEEEIRSKSVV